MVKTFSRQTAIICTVADLKKGDWIQKEGMESSGVQSTRGFVSRANILGVIVDRSSEQSILLDDGTHQITVRTFDKPFPEVTVGDVVVIVGRPREYQNERYLVLEICKKLTHPGWTTYRKKELSLFQTIAEPSFTVPTIQEEPEQSEAKEEVLDSPVVTEESTASQKEENNPMNALISKIKALDEGSGAAVDELLTIPDAERMIQTLTEEGDIFEIKPGRVKVLE